MKSIITDQSIKIDAHVSGKEPLLKDVHIHKKTNKHNRSVDIKIPIDKNQDITMDDRKSGQEIKNEMKKVFKKSERKMREFASEAVNQIDRYDEMKTMGKEKRDEILKDYADRLAGFFELPRFKDVMVAEAENQLFMLTSHMDNSNKLFYIKQDITRKYIKIGDDLEQLFHGNENYHDKSISDNIELSEHVRQPHGVPRPGRH
jgi:hypothetical protein